MNEHNPKRLWIICLETLDHKLDRAVVLQESQYKRLQREYVDLLPYLLERNQSCQR